VEVVVDEDDTETTIPETKVQIRICKSPTHPTMAQLNGVGFSQARGTYLMIGGDDICIETPGWDTICKDTFARHDDGAVLGNAEPASTRSG